MLQGLFGSNLLGGTFVRSSSVANTTLTNCTTQHSFVKITERLTISGNMVDLLMIRTLVFPVLGWVSVPLLAGRRGQVTARRSIRRWPCPRLLPCRSR